MTAAWLSPHGRAAAIPGLFNTGVDDAGAPLGADAVDPHWRLVESADVAAPGPDAFVVRAGFPIPPWIANGPASNWIAPQADQSGGNLPGNYTYRLTFDLTGFDAATATLTGRWSSDNAGVAVRLNGQETGITFDGTFSDFSPEFALSSGFLDGTNTIEFVVNNAGDGVNPTGFRAEIQGAAEPNAPADAPPQITRPPQSLTVPFKAPASFSVGASGGRPLAYQWRRGGGPLAGETNATLLIPFASALDGGSYDVVVSNAFGAATSAEATLALIFPSPAQLNSEPPGPSSRRTGVAITEIMYHPAPRTDGRELAFIELYNANPFFEDLSGWRLTGDADFTFPAKTVLPGGSYLVLAAQPDELRAAYGLTNVLGGWTGQLSHGGGMVRLRKRSGAVVLEVQYADQPPWPLAADGAGHSLVLVRPSYGEADPRAWAASAAKGGSPGAADPLPSGPLENLVINEILAAPAPGQRAWIELANAGARPLDAGGCWLGDTPAAAKFQVPAGTVLGPGEFVVFDEVQLGFVPGAAGGRWFLSSPDQDRVLDAVACPAELTGFSHGRWPPGAGAFRELSAPTPGAANAPTLIREVGLSEILFHPISEDPADEFVEVHNRGTHSVDLTGWRFVDGIDFEFPVESVLAPGGYLVVARDAARFRASHPALPANAVTGDFQGGLSGRGEHLALARPVIYPGRATPAWAVMAEALYAEATDRSHWADGGGSSLELVDPRADPLVPDNWIDSDESGKADWTLVEATGVLDLVHPAVPSADQLQVILLGAGEALVDNVEVRVGNGANRIANGGFESGVGGWFFQGTQRMSRLASVAGFNSAHCLDLVASERGDHVANRARTRLSSPIPAGQTATIRARVKWLAGHPEILFRLRGGGLEAVGRLHLSPTPGTPGGPPSRAEENAGPTITDVSHRPVLPAAGQPVRVFARVTDPDGVSAVKLRFRIDPALSPAEVPMVDDGSGPDELAGDGVFTGLIPGQPGGALVAFYVEAADGAGPVATARCPTDAPARECLMRFGESVPASGFGTYRFWITDANRAFWAGREKMSNEDVEATFVYGTNRVIYHAGAHYSGSSYTAPGYDSPTGNLCGYNLSFPAPDRFLGETHLTLDWPIRDATEQREQLMFWFLEQYGLPNMYRRYVNLFVNGLHRGTIYDDVQQPGADTVDEWFRTDADGSLLKTDCWNEFDDAGNRLDPCILNTLEEFTTTGGAKKVARYRWNWRPRAVRGSANDFTDLFALVDAVNATTDYQAGVESLVDVDHWMRTFAMNDLASFWDAFGNPNAKNTFLYKPPGDTWKLMCWDFDVGLGVFNDPVNASLFDVDDPTITRMYRTPAWVRRYWAALQEALDGFFKTGTGTPINALLDAKYAAFRADKLALADPSEIKSWINQRRAYLQTQLNTVRANFAVTSPVGTVTTSQSPLVIRGTAPVGVRTLQVNGSVYPVVWNTVTGWELRVPLQSGLNELTVAGVDRLGQAIAGASAKVTVNFTGTPATPPALRINEWMAANRSTLVDPADGAFDDWFELYNPGDTAVSLAGWRLTDSLADPAQFIVPTGVSVPARGFLLVWADGQPEQTQPGGDLHVNFRLSQEGEAIALFDALGQLVDAVEFGPQADDVSQGRWPDGAPEPFFALPQPTPSAANALPAEVQAGVRLVDLQSDPSGAVTLSFSSLPGRRYRVSYCASLLEPWTTISADIIAVESTTSWRDSSLAGVARRFYRVVLVP